MWREQGFCSCGCGGFPRRYISAKEEKEMLEAYREQLKKELAGVEEAIQKLKGK
jgi:hypothetical protein